MHVLYVSALRGIRRFDFRRAPFYEQLLSLLVVGTASRKIQKLNLILSPTDENGYHYVLRNTIELERNASTAHLPHLLICQPIPLSNL